MLQQKKSRQSEILSTKDLAERWHMSYRTLINWRSLKKGPKYFKVGSSVRYRLADIIDFESDQWK